LVSFFHLHRQQHTISWTQDLVVGDVKLAASACNLYGFPALVGLDKMTQEGEKKLAWTPIVKGRQLELLCRILLAAAMSPDTKLLTNPDASGAYFCHALLIANTEASVSLAMAIFEKKPKLLLQVRHARRAAQRRCLTSISPAYAPTSTPPPPTQRPHARPTHPVSTHTQRHTAGGFAGELGLHVLVVNQRQRELSILIKLALENLTTEEVITMVSTQVCRPDPTTTALMQLRKVPTRHPAPEQRGITRTSAQSSSQLKLCAPRRIAGQGRLLRRCADAVLRQHPVGLLCGVWLASSHSTPLQQRGRSTLSQPE
jgi:hypothetical protein